MTCNLVPNHPILLLLLEKQKVHSIPVMAADPANFDEEEEAELLYTYSSSPDCHVDPYRHVDQPNLEKKS